MNHGQFVHLCHIPSLGKMRHQIQDQILVWYRSGTKPYRTISLRAGRTIINHVPEHNSKATQLLSRVLGIPFQLSSTRLKMRLSIDQPYDGAVPSRGSIYIDEPIAIVGLAMRLPGQVHTVEEFWEMLVSKRDGRIPVPPTRYHAESRFDPIKGPVSGHFLHEDPARFDAPFFAMSAQEAAQLDPQQRLLLEVVWECLENAGETSWRGAQVGVYVGVFGEDWLELSLKSQQRTNPYQTLATGGFALSNRISYEFDFRGPW